MINIKRCHFCRRYYEVELLDVVQVRERRMPNKRVDICPKCLKSLAIGVVREVVFDG